MPILYFSDRCPLVKLYLQELSDSRYAIGDSASLPAASLHCRQLRVLLARRVSKTHNWFQNENYWQELFFQFKVLSGRSRWGFPPDPHWGASGAPQTPSARS
jgi:hypothetical protein